MIISIVSFKGGVGKTTTAIHLAARLNVRARTLLVDGDPNRSALGWAERGGGELGFKIIDEEDLQNTAATHKHVIVDTPARPTVEELQTLATDSDLLLIPTTPDALSLHALLKIIESLQSFNAQNYRILLNMVPPRSNAGRDAKALLDDLNAPYCKTEIRRRAVCARAALQGTTVDKLRDGSESWAEFTMLGKEIMK